MTLHVDEIFAAATPEEFQAAVFRFASAAADVLADVYPQEVKRVNLRASDFPMYLSTRVERPIAVVVAQVYETDDPSSTVGDGTGVHAHWRRTDDEEAPGILLDTVGGLTANTDYTVTLVIIGERE